MPEPLVVVVGGGVAGCAAAIAARKAGLDAIVIERTDMLLAGVNRAGRLLFNGKVAAAEEAKALGGGEVFEALESIVIHRTGLIGEEHVAVYDCSLAEPTVKRLMEDFGIRIMMERQAKDVVVKGKRITSVLLNKREEIKGTVFIDATGSTGGLAVCKKYGNGCVMCNSFRCIAFGDRISIAAKAGVREVAQHRPDGAPGLISSAISLHKGSLEKKLRDRLENEGTVLVPMPKNLIDYSKWEKISSVSLREQQAYLNLTNIGPVIKCVKLGFMHLNDLRTIPGLEHAQIEDPLAGGKGGYIKSISMAPRDNTLKAPGLDNLFLAGEKCGPIGGIAECIITGIVAGNNAARAAVGAAPLELPRTVAIGDYIALTGENMETEQGLRQGWRMGQGLYFQRMKEKGFYSPDPAEAPKRVQKAGLTGILSKKVC